MSVELRHRRPKTECSKALNEQSSHPYQSSAPARWNIFLGSVSPLAGKRNTRAHRGSSKKAVRLVPIVLEILRPSAGEHMTFSARGEVVQHGDKRRKAKEPRKRELAELH